MVRGRRHDNAGGAKSLRVERTAFVPREQLLVVLWGGVDGELEVERTETPTLMNAVQSLLEAPHQRRGIAFLHVEEL